MIGDMLGMAAGGSLGNLFVRLTADSSQLVKGMREAELAVTGGSARILGQVKTLALGVTGALAAIGGAAAFQFIKFDKAMTESLAIMGDVAEGTKRQMAEVARALSGKTIQSAAELAKAYFFLGSAGLSAEQAMGALPVVAQFATAGLFDLNVATTLLMDSQSALGMRSADAAQNIVNMTRITDVLTKANILANAEVRDFAEALSNKAAAALKMVHKDVEEGVAVLAAFAEQGIKGVAAGEALAIVMRDLQRTAIENKIAYEKFGVVVFDSSGKMQNMGDIVGQLEQALGNASDKHKRMTLEMMGFQDRSVSNIMALLGMSGAIKDYEAKLLKAGGTTKEVGDKMLGSFASQLTMLKNKFNELLLVVGESLIPAMKDLMAMLEGLIASMTPVKGETAALVTIFQSAIGVLKIMALGIVVVWTTFKSMATIMGSGIQELMSAWDGFTQLFGVWWEAAKGVIEGLGQIAKSAASASTVMFALFHGDFAGAKAAAVGMLKGVSGALIDITNQVAGVVDKSAKIVVNTLDEVNGVAADGMEDLKNQWLSLLPIHENLFNPVVKGAEVAAELVVSEFDKMMASIAKAGEKAGKAFVDAAESRAERVLRMNAAQKLFGKMGATDSTLSRLGLDSDEDRGNLQLAGVSEDTLKKLGTPKMKVGMGFGAGLGPSAKLKQEKEDQLSLLKIQEEMGKDQVDMAQNIANAKLAIEKDYHNKVKELNLASQQLALSAGESMFSTLADIAEKSAGRQSSQYMAMFAMQKAFSIATAMLNIQKAISDGFAQGTTIWEKLAAVAIIGSQTASILSSMMAVKLNLSGNARAMGGPVSPGSTFLVGERGPELFTPSASGTIIPNNRLGGDRGTRVVVNNYTDVQPRVTEKDQDHEKVIEVMIRRVKNEIGGDIRDGVGTVSTAMEKSFGLRRGKA